jgi:hypothetical protein
MPFTLEQLDFLGVHVGVVIPPEFIENKRRAEEFKARREKLTAEAGGKPADWRLKTGFDEALKRAVDAAGQREFDAALKLLDEAGDLLRQPDAPPPPIATSPPTAAPAQADVPASAVSNHQEFLRAWSAARAAWTSAVEAVDAQISKLQQVLGSSNDEELQAIAEFGLNGVTGNYKVPLLAAMQNVDEARDDARGVQARRAVAIATGFLKHLQSERKIQACDENPFGVQVSIRQTLGGALAQLNDALKLA